MYKINIRKKILKGIKTRDLRTQGMTWGEFLGFSFCLIYPKLGAEEVRKKSLRSLIKRPGKGQPSKAENFYAITALF